MPMASWHIQMFGQLRIARDGEPLAGIEPRKAQELFCYLLFYRGHVYPRETLAGLLWGDSTTAQSKKSLRQALWQLQSGLGAPAPASTIRLLLVEPEWVQINQQADLWLDVAEFEAIYEAVQGCRGEEFDGSVAARVRSAVELYRGDLLEGCYLDWCIYERERLQSMYLTLLDKLMAHCSATAAYELGLTYGMQILRYNRAHERTHSRLMNMYYAAGDRASALRQYQRCAAALQEELGASPSQRTATLYAQIQADQLEERSPAEPEPAPREGAAPIRLLLKRLQQRWLALVALEREIHEDIVAIESALGESLH
jgi:DNA-binding SARP family transcriptional activator